MNRYTKLDATGAALPDDAAEWVAVRDNHLVLIDGEYRHLVWARAETADRHDHASAIKTAAGTGIGGWTDWRLPTVDELASLPDRSCFDPAIDTRYFETNGTWCWSSTVDASDPAYAWYVYFSLGLVLDVLRGGSGFVRAVRSVPPSQ